MQHITQKIIKNFAPYLRQFVADWDALGLQLCGVRVNPPVEILRQSVHVLEPVLLRERERERNLFAQAIYRFSQQIDSNVEWAIAWPKLSTDCQRVYIH